MGIPQTATNLQPLTTGRDDPFVRTTKWLFRAGEEAKDLDWMSKTTRSHFSKTLIKDRKAAEIDNPKTALDDEKLDPERVASALEQVKCSLDPKPADGAMGALRGFFEKLDPRPEDLKIDGQKISYKDLQVSVMEGPNEQPEVSISYSGSMDNLEEADGQLEAFVALLGKKGETIAVDDGGHRTLTIDGTVMGLPMENVFTQGIRYKVLEHEGKKRVILGQPCVEGLRSVAKDNKTIESFDRAAGKITAHDKYAAAFSTVIGNSSKGLENLAREERKAAFTGGELEHLITLLRNEGKAGNAHPPRPLSMSSLARLDMPKDDRELQMQQRKISDLEQQLAERDGQIGTLQGENAAQAGQIAVLTEEINKVEQQQVDRDKRIAALTQQLEEQTNQNHTLTGQLAERDGQITTAQSQNTDLRKRIGEEEALSENLTNKNSELKTANGKLKDENAAQKKQVDAQRAEAEQRQAALQGQIAIVTGQLKAAERARDAARDENADLQSRLGSLQEELQAIEVSRSLTQEGHGQMLTKLGQELKRLQTENANLQEESSTLRDDNATLQAKLQEEVSHSQGKLDKLNSKFSKLQRDSDTLQREKERLTQQLEEQTNQNHTLTGQLAERDGQITTAQSQNTDLRKRIGEEEALSENLTNKNSELKTANGKLKDENAAQKKQVDAQRAEAEQRQAALQGQIAIVTGQLKAAERARDAAQGEKERLTQQLEEQTNQNRTLAGQLEEQREANERLRKEFSDLKIAFEFSTKQTSSQGDKIEELRKNINELKIQNATLEEELKKAKSQLDELRPQLSEARSQNAVQAKQISQLKADDEALRQQLGENQQVLRMLFGAKQPLRSEDISLAIGYFKAFPNFRELEELKSAFLHQLSENLGALSENDVNQLTKEDRRELLERASPKALEQLIRRDKQVFLQLFATLRAVDVETIRKCFPFLSETEVLLPLQASISEDIDRNSLGENKFLHSRKLWQAMAVPMASFCFDESGKVNMERVAALKLALTNQGSFFYQKPCSNVPGIELIRTQAARVLGSPELFLVLDNANSLEPNDYGQQVLSAMPLAGQPPLKLNTAVLASLLSPHRQGGGLSTCTINSIMNADIHNNPAVPAEMMIQMLATGLTHTPSGYVLRSPPIKNGSIAVDLSEGLENEVKEILDLGKADMQAIYGIRRDEGNEKVLLLSIFDANDLLFAAYFQASLFGNKGLKSYDWQERGTMFMRHGIKKSNEVYLNFITISDSSRSMEAAIESMQSEARQRRDVGESCNYMRICTAEKSGNVGHTENIDVDALLKLDLSKLEKDKPHIIGDRGWVLETGYPRYLAVVKTSGPSAESPTYRFKTISPGNIYARELNIIKIRFFATEVKPHESRLWRVNEAGTIVYEPDQAAPV